MSVLDFGLRLAGMPETTIRELETHLPHLARIVDASKEAEPLIQQLLPIINKAWPDVVAVTPLIQQLVAFAKMKEGES